MIAIELFFIVNLVMDYYILYLSLKWLDVCKVSVWRLLAASALGSAYACAAWGGARILLAPPLTLAAAIPMTRIAAGRKPPKTILKGAGFTIAAAFLSAGTVYALGRMAPKVPLIPTLLASALVTGVAAAALGRNKRRARWVKGTVYVRLGEAQCRFDAAIDSGNHAVDPATALPVIVVQARTIARPLRLPEAALSAASGGLPEGFRLMALRTVAGTCLAPVFTPDALTWNGKPVRAAVALSRGDLPLALAPSCFAEGGGTDERNDDSNDERIHA